MEQTKGALIRYLLASFGLTWLLWTPIVLAGFGLPSFSNPYVSGWFGDFTSGQANTIAHWLTLLGGVLGPSVGALVAWHHLDSKGGALRLWRQLVDIRLADWKGWLSAFLPAFYFGVAAALLFALTGALMGFDLSIPSFLFLLACSLLLIIGEEIGWRGTLLPIVQEQRGALVASVIVGVVWAWWHLPLWLMSGTPSIETPADFLIALIFPLAIYPLLAIPMAVMCTFAFNMSRGLILVPVLLHGLHNFLNARIVPISASEEQLAAAGPIAEPILFGITWLILFALWFKFGASALSPRNKVTVSSILSGKNE